jgi:transposase
MGQRLQIEWQESAEELKALYKCETHPQRRTRLQTLWQLRTGKRRADVVESVGVSYRAVQQGVAWYRAGGLAEVLRRVTGYASQGTAPHLNAKQQRALAARVALRDFKTVWEVIQWAEDRWGVQYSYQNVLTHETSSIEIEVPRPQSDKADPAQQTAWKKGGL